MAKRTALLLALIKQNTDNHGEPTSHSLAHQAMKASGFGALATCTRLLEPRKYPRHTPAHNPSQHQCPLEGNLGALVEWEQQHWRHGAVRTHLGLRKNQGNTLDCYYYYYCYYYFLLFSLFLLEKSCANNSNNIEMFFSHISI